ncbi:MAG: peptidase A26, partial [Muribaculaceae bacterium]|nr:peptidase A26 [Muribaculaceae bacterium]
MKKCLFMGAMAAMLLGTASCSSDMEPAMGGETPVSFSINLGDDIDSRTISDGLKANQLKFAVFENGTEIPGLAQTVAVADKKATVTTRLVKGHTYKFVFWAQNSECTAYNTDNMAAIKVDYATVNCNDESRDAFY